MNKYVFSLFVALAAPVLCYEVDTYDFLMPNVHPHRDELYLCTPIRISPQSSYYIVGFEPNATMHTAHHMLLYGCTEPGTNEQVWSCGEMQSNEIDKMYETASPCGAGSQPGTAFLSDDDAEDGNGLTKIPQSIGELLSSSRNTSVLSTKIASSPLRWGILVSLIVTCDQIVYAWARDAPSLQLPPKVGFRVGKGSPIKYLVLQVHYMSAFPEGKTDDSGVFLKYTTERLPRLAGVYLLGTDGTIAAKRVERMETACALREDKVIHPFAFRTHTHSLGQLVTGYVVHQSENGDVWRLLGKKNPQRPQMFYPVLDETPIAKGDVLAARCTMNNTNDHSVHIGATNKDEMCNFYLMYWVENDTPLEQKYCFSPGPPYYYWSRSPEINFNRIPEEEASTL